MRLIPSRVLPLFSLAVLAACGSPPPPAPPAPPAPTTTQVAKDPPVDVSSVPEPPALVILARVNKPDVLMKTVSDWTHLSFPAKELIRSVSNDALADIVDLSQPIDAAGTLALSRHGVDPQFAFAVGVKSFDDAKAKIGAKFKMDPVTNGGFKVHSLLDKGPPPAAPGRDGDNGDNDDDDDVCILAHAATGARLVCGNNAAVDNLTPYLSRTMPRSSWPADVHIEVHPDPIRGPLGDMRGSLPMLAKAAIGSNSAAVRDMIDGSVTEAMDILDDSQRITLDATVSDKGVNETTRWEFQSNKSVFARALTDAGRADAPPASFWHLPAETDMAFFMRGSDAKLYDHPREILTNLMMEGMDSAGMPDAEKKAVHDLVADRMLKVFMDGGTGIFARGFDQAALLKAMQKRQTMPQDDWNADHEGQNIVGEQVIGWNLYQVSEPIAQVGPILKDWSSLWNRPAFAKWIETKTGTDKKEMPRMKISPPPAGVTGLPKDTVHLEVTFPPDQEPKWAAEVRKKGAAPAKKAPPPHALVAHVFAVPDGANTWIAFGLDGKLVGTKVAQSLASAPDATSLGKSAIALDALKNGKMNGGGFATMRGFLVVTAMERSSKDDPSVFEQSMALPKKAGAPIVFTGKAEMGTPQAKSGANVSSVVVSRDVIEDTVKLFFALKK